MSDTPRTDAILTTDNGMRILPQGRWFPQLADLCRELEREVAAQKVCISEGKREWELMESMDNAAMDKMQAMIREQSESLVALGEYAEELQKAARYAIEHGDHSRTEAVAWLEAALAKKPQSGHEIGTGWIEHTDSDGKVKREPTTAEGAEFLRQAEEGHAVGHSERDLLRIIVSGPHCIDDDTAAFYRDPGKPGNALHQLVHRVSGFLSQYSLPAGAWVEHGGGWVKVHALSSLEAVDALCNFLAKVTP